MADPFETGFTDEETERFAGLIHMMQHHVSTGPSSDGVALLRGKLGGEPVAVIVYVEHDPLGENYTPMAMLIDNETSRLIQFPDGLQRVEAEPND